MFSMVVGQTNEPADPHICFGLYLKHGCIWLFPYNSQTNERIWTTNSEKLDEYVYYLYFQIHKN